MNAYDDLSAFQVKAGKGYDKRSVEEFRAHALTAVDDLMRLNVQLQDRLAGPASPGAQPAPAVALHPEEQHILNRYRALTPLERADLLRGLDRNDNAAPAEAPKTGNALRAEPATWSEPAGWGDSPATDPSAPPPSTIADGIAWDTPTTEARSASELTPTSFSQPDWLTEWESVAPDTGREPEASFSGFAAPPANWPVPYVQTAVAADDDLGWSQTDMVAPAWDIPPVGAPFAPPATLPPFMPPPQPASEVGVPMTADAISATAFHSPFGESPLSQEHLDDLFNQLDFGPPSVDLLPHGESSSSLTAHVAPLHVGLAPESDQPLPPPVRPWEGWIR